MVSRGGVGVKSVEGGGEGAATAVGDGWKGECGDPPGKARAGDNEAGASTCVG